MVIPTLGGPVSVKEVTKEEIILDMNHRLAGKTLVFDLELVSIESEEEPESESEV